MPFIKLVKNNAYYKRFQTHFRRRREGKTDYAARQALILQDKNKYNQPKFRLVARITNKTVIAQIVSSRIKGDFVLCSAYSSELPRYGIPVGLTNYAACYATGLLLARRLLKQLSLDSKYDGVSEVTGELSQVTPLEDGPRPFRCYLDTGLRRTSTGSRVFSVLKGASDGGLDIPHSEKRFVGFKKGKFDPKVLRAHIFGGHVANYMRLLQDKEDTTKFESQFAAFIKHDISADKLEAMYHAAHVAIRENPDRVSKEHVAPAEPYHRQIKPRLSTADRRNRMAQKLAHVQKKLAAQAVAIPPPTEETAEAADEEDD